jgi:hypothetical protein
VLGVRHPRGQDAKVKYCIARAACGTWSGSVAGGKIGSGNLSDRVIEQFRIVAGKATPRDLIGVATKNGAGPTDAMGKYAKGIKTDLCHRCRRQAQAGYFKSDPPKDRRGPTSAVGQDSGSKEGGITGLNSTVRGRHGHTPCPNKEDYEVVIGPCEINGPIPS